MGVEWTVMDEIRLLRWVSEYKPVGIHKHFHMMCILERMNHPETYPVVLLQKETVRIDKQFTARDIWLKLGQYYNLEESDRLEDSVFKEGAEIIPGIESDNYRLLAQGRDFTLPWDEYSELILKNARHDAAASNDGGISSSNSSSKSNGENNSRRTGAIDATIAATVANSDQAIATETKKTAVENTKSPSLGVEETKMDIIEKSEANNNSVVSKSKDEENGNSKPSAVTKTSLRKINSEHGIEESTVNKGADDTKTVHKNQQNHKMATKETEPVIKNDEESDTIVKPLDQQLPKAVSSVISPEETTLENNKQAVKESIGDNEETLVVDGKQERGTDDSSTKAVLKESKEVSANMVEDNQEKGSFKGNNTTPIQGKELEKKPEQHTPAPDLTTSEVATPKDDVDRKEETGQVKKADADPKDKGENIAQEKGGQNMEPETEKKLTGEENELGLEQENKETSPVIQEQGGKDDKETPRTGEHDEEEGSSSDTHARARVEARTEPEPAPEPELEPETKIETGTETETRVETKTESKVESKPESEKSKTPEVTAETKLSKAAEKGSYPTARIKKRRKRESDIFQASAAIIGGILDDEPLAKRTRHSSANLANANTITTTTTTAKTSSEEKAKNTTTNSSSSSSSKTTAKPEGAKKKKKKKYEKRVPAKGTRSSSRLRDKKLKSLNKVEQTKKGV